MYQNLPHLLKNSPTEEIITYSISGYFNGKLIITIWASTPQFELQNHKKNHITIKSFALMTNPAWTQTEIVIRTDGYLSICFIVIRTDGYLFICFIPLFIHSFNYLFYIQIILL